MFIVHGIVELFSTSEIIKLSIAKMFKFKYDFLRDHVISVQNMHIFSVSHFYIKNTNPS
jgi:hypothetical protein